MIKGGWRVGVLTTIVSTSEHTAEFMVPVLLGPVLRVGPTRQINHIIICRGMTLVVNAERHDELSADSCETGGDDLHDACLISEPGYVTSVRVASVASEAERQRQEVRARICLPPIFAFGKICAWTSLSRRCRQARSRLARTASDSLHAGPRNNANPRLIMLPPSTLALSSHLPSSILIVQSFVPSIDV